MNQEKKELIINLIKVLIKVDVENKGHISESTYAIIKENRFILFARKCDECNKLFNEGYCISGGIEYYCSDKCLDKHISHSEWKELYNEGDGDSYYTTWEDLEDFSYLKDGTEIDRINEKSIILKIDNGIVSAIENNSNSKILVRDYDVTNNATLKDNKNNAYNEYEV